ncbi:MAG: S41 family peptidase [Alphaproteobacteria bacterium]
MTLSPVRRSTARATVALLAFALAACSSSPGNDHPSFEANSNRLFTASYGSISDRYLEPVTFETLTISGLNGLSSIDPTVTASKADGNIKLVARGQDAGMFPMPKSNDPKSWAALTSSAIISVRAVSPAVNVADDDAVYQAVFDSALAKLDGFSRYSGPETAREERNRRVGFGGVGVRLQTAGGRIEVLSVMPDTPAAHAGVKAGDRILQIDGVTVKNRDVKDIIEQLRGGSGTQVQLVVERANVPDPLTFQLVREKIIPRTVISQMDGRVLEIKVSAFNQDTSRAVSQELSEALAKPNPQVSAIVLDLRDNPGGLLDQAIQVADLFLEKGAIMTAKGRHPDSVQHVDASGTDVTGGLPLAVLVNGGTASSAEVLAAALQDNGRAVVIGTNSYGKGTVQSVIHMPNDGELVLTWSRLYAPSGYSLHHLGILPMLCTSGTGGTGVSATKILENQRRPSDQMQAAAQRWHAVTSPESDSMSELRATCRSERATREVDMEVARQVLADSGAYRQVIRLSMAEVAGR